MKYFEGVMCNCFFNVFTHELVSCTVFISLESVLTRQTVKKDYVLLQEYYIICIFCCN